MSLPYNRHYALNSQAGHGLHHSQVLETYPITAPGQTVPGGYQADGSVVNWSRDCNVVVTDQYNMPGCCSVWAAAPPPVQCCPNQ